MLNIAQQYKRAAIKASTALAVPLLSMMQYQGLCDDVMCVLFLL